MLNEHQQKLLIESFYLYVYSRYGKDLVDKKISQLSFEQRHGLEESILSDNEDESVAILGLTESVESGDNPYSSARPGTTPRNNSSQSTVGTTQSMNAPDSGVSNAKPSFNDKLKGMAKKAFSPTKSIDRKELKPGEKVVAVDKDGNQVTGKVTKNSFSGLSIDAAGKMLDIGKDEEYTFLNADDPEVKAAQKVQAQKSMSQGKKVASAFLDPNESAELDRLKELAGVDEMSSGGASCAGGIAVAPMPAETPRKKKKR